MDSELVVDLARDGADFPRTSRGSHLILKASRTVTGLDLSGLAWRSIVIDGGVALWRNLVPPWLKPAALDGRGAVLMDADLRSADLTGADLRQARLEGADLQDAVLTGADLAGVGHGPSPATGRPTQWPKRYAAPAEDRERG